MDGVTDFVADVVTDLVTRKGIAWRPACSRCAAFLPDYEPSALMTSGYYLADSWPQYANPGEFFICDACMHADPRYQAVYGVLP